MRVFRIVATDGSTTHWATNDLTMTALTRRQMAEASWKIEEYHRGIKQYCGAERAQVRAARAQRNHIGLALRAFLRLEPPVLHDRGQLVRGQNRHHPRRGPRVFG